MKEEQKRPRNPYNRGVINSNKKETPSEILLRKAKEARLKRERAEREKNTTVTARDCRSNAMLPIIVKVKKLTPEVKMPYKATGQDNNFCYDLYCTSVEEIKPGVFCYGTGLAFEIMDTDLRNNYELSIDGRPRSSIYKTGLSLCNCTATIDDPYRGEVKAMFYQIKTGPEFEPYKVGDRIIQVKIGLTPKCKFVEVANGERLSETVRGERGFGSSDETNNTDDGFIHLPG